VQDIDPSYTILHHTSHFTPPTPPCSIHTHTHTPSSTTYNKANPTTPTTNPTTPFAAISNPLAAPVDSGGTPVDDNVGLAALPVTLPEWPGTNPLLIATPDGFVVIVADLTGGVTIGRPGVFVIVGTAIEGKPESEYSVSDADAISVSVCNGRPSPPLVLVTLASTLSAPAVGLASTLPLALAAPVSAAPPKPDMYSGEYVAVPTYPSQPGTVVFGGARPPPQSRNEQISPVPGTQ
jgi:hypothetical protein